MQIKAEPFTHRTDVISERQFDAHMILYHGYVDKSNEISAQLAKGADRDAANATYSVFRGLKRGESYALDGVILHEQYFQNLI